jgi:hypothetical protein
MALITSASDVFDYVAGHLAIIGWPVLLGLIWKARGAIDAYFSDQKTASDKISKTLAAVDDAKATAVEEAKKATEHGAQKAQELLSRIDANQLKIESTANLLKQVDENHLEHMQADIRDQKQTMDEHLKVLLSIDTNIKILADRGMPRSRGRK